MTFYAETWTAADEMDYLNSGGATVGITKADAYKGIAARFNGAQADGESRPIASKTNAANQVVIGAITHVGSKGCKIVKRGRFVLQAATAYEASDLYKTVQSTTTAGKVEATSAAAQQGELCIIGGGNDTDPDGIGHFYLVERLS